MTICPFALATGGACPGCGMTRALINLLHGDLGTAMEYHPLILVVTVEILFMGIWFVLRRSNRVAPLRRWPINVVVVLTAVAMMVVWVARYQTGTLPPV